MHEAMWVPVCVARARGPKLAEVLRIGMKPENLNAGPGPGSLAVLVPCDAKARRAPNLKTSPAPGGPGPVSMPRNLPGISLPLADPEIPNSRSPDSRFRVGRRGNGPGVCRGREFPAIPDPAGKRESGNRGYPAV